MANLLLDQLRSAFPNGHKDFLPILLEMAELHSMKNHDYAKGGDALGNFKRVSAIKRLYPEMDWASPEGTALDYMLKQLDAVLWGMAKGIEAKVEGPDGRLADIAVYATIVRCMVREAF